MSQKRSRLARKGARTVERELQGDIAVELGKARAARDKTLAEIARKFREGQAKLEEARAEARAKAHEQYDATRDALVKDAAERERVAS